MVEVYVWPGQDVLRLPRGTTAGQVLEKEGVLAVGEEDGDGASVLQRPVANVNNRLVDEGTVLQDGDLVVLARQTLKL